MRFDSTSQGLVNRELCHIREVLPQHSKEITNLEMQLSQNKRISQREWQEFLHLQKLALKKQGLLKE